MQRPFLAHSRLYPLLVRARHPINSQQQQCFWLRGSVAASSQYRLLLSFNLSTCAACPALLSSFIKALLRSLCGSGKNMKRKPPELNWRHFSPHPRGSINYILKFCQFWFLTGIFSRIRKSKLVWLKIDKDRGRQQHGQKEQRMDFAGDAVPFNKKVYFTAI